MKKVHIALVVAISAFAGSAFAQAPQKTTSTPPAASTQHGQMDHSKMDMSGKKPADHSKMAASEFAALDKNKDGKLSAAEVRAKSSLKPHFAMLDANKDGTLSKAEHAKHHGK